MLWNWWPVYSGKDGRNPPELVAHFERNMQKAHWAGQFSALMFKIPNF
jgi:hypothetical protein